jgi:hypothetical protein
MRGYRQRGKSQEHGFQSADCSVPPAQGAHTQNMVFERLAVGA